eukprot:s11_g82.t1
MINSRCIARKLAKRCQGGHPHQVLEGGGRTKRAEVYPPKLCKAIIDGLKEEIAQGKAEESQLWAFPSFDEVYEGEELEEEEDVESDIEDKLDEEVERSGRLPGWRSTERGLRS